jgi:hypothetical protein
VAEKYCKAKCQSQFECCSGAKIQILGAKEAPIIYEN